MASVTVTHVPGTAYQTRIDTGDLSLIGDEPAGSGGDGRGPSPYELLLASLAHCTVLTLLLYARRKEWPLDGVSIRASHERMVIDEFVESAPSRRKVERIVQEIMLTGPLDSEQRTRLMEIAGKCPVHRTLTGELQITEIATEQGAPAARA